MSDWHWDAVSAIATAFAIPGAIGAAYYTVWGTNRAAARTAQDRKLVIARRARAALEVLASVFPGVKVQTRQVADGTWDICGHCCFVQ